MRQRLPKTAHLFDKFVRFVSQIVLLYVLPRIPHLGKPSHSERTEIQMWVASSSSSAVPRRIASSRRRCALYSQQQSLRQYGFGSFHQQERVAGALPKHQFSPQNPPYGLYPELLSGTTFTAPRAKNRYTWMYRKRPSVSHDSLKSEYKLAKAISGHRWTVAPAVSPVPPLQFRFPKVGIPTPSSSVDFLDGVTTLAVTGSAAMQNGAAAGVYQCNTSMNSRVFRNHDAEMMLIPESGTLTIRTELGTLTVEPQEFALLPRGLAFQVQLGGNGVSSGYVLENFGALFQLPELGPIGISSGLAHPRHFTPGVLEKVVAAGSSAAQPAPPTSFEIVAKFGDNFFSGTSATSPLDDVVAYFGSYLPVKYNFDDFMAINTVTYDHPDPCIGSVLSSYTDQASGLANIDFVVFPPRYVVAENTFRPPWFHRNFMSEFMGLVHGSYDAKKGFVPGASSIHNSFVPHGPDAGSVAAGTAKDTSEPEKYTSALAFMWETCRIWKPTEYAMKIRDREYRECWKGLEDRFDETTGEVEQKRPFQT